jgi:glycosyltransferase involved in cell wall biosynthesis
MPAQYHHKPQQVLQNTFSCYPMAHKDNLYDLNMSYKVFTLIERKSTITTEHENPPRSNYPSYNRRSSAQIGDFHMIKLSICVPTFNRLETLKKLLSILKSVVDPQIEILVSDDSTNDETEKYFAENPFENIKYYRNYSNMGQFKNCNACLARSSGEWVQILHDDDDIDIDYLQYIKQYLDDPELSIVTGQSDIVEHGKVQGVESAHQQKLATFAIDFGQTMDGRVFKYKMLKFGNPLVFSHTIFRRDLAISHGGFNVNLKFVGDFDLWLKLLSSGNVVFLNKKIGSYYLHNDNQLTTRDTFVQQAVELMALKIELLSFFETIATENEIKEYKADIVNNIGKYKFLSSMIRNRNSYSKYSYTHLLSLSKSKKPNGQAPLLKAALFNGAYLASTLCPDTVFKLYSFLKSSR